MDEQGASREFQQDRLDVELQVSSVSPAESSTEVQIPSLADLAEVHRWQGVIAHLESDLDDARRALRDAWKLVPFDPSVTRKPYKSDIQATCRECGGPTLWRDNKGHARHVGGCPTSKQVRKTTHGIPQAVWDILDGLTGSENDEKLDDD